eukprot:12769-Heterococcus_DN1.PRE.2
MQTACPPDMLKLSDTATAQAEYARPRTVIAPAVHRSVALTSYAALLRGSERCLLASLCMVLVMQQCAAAANY